MLLYMIVLLGRRVSQSQLSEDTTSHPASFGQPPWFLNMSKARPRNPSIEKVITFWVYRSSQGERISRSLENQSSLQENVASNTMERSSDSFLYNATRAWKQREQSDKCQLVKAACFLRLCVTVFVSYDLAHVLMSISFDQLGCFL